MPFSRMRDTIWCAHETSSSVGIYISPPPLSRLPKILLTQLCVHLVKFLTYYSDWDTDVRVFSEEGCDGVSEQCVPIARVDKFLAQSASGPAAYASLHDSN